VALLAEADLERLAGRDRLARARCLVDSIDDLYEDEFSLCGTVIDGASYLAMVHHRVGQLSGECECPNGDPPGLCEHSVAVGLCYLGDG